MESYQAFSKWLKTQNKKLVHIVYPQYMQKVESILMMPLHNVKNPNLLKALYKEFEIKRGFTALSKKEQSNLKTGFASYIEFVSLKIQPEAEIVRDDDEQSN
ncbi:MAG: hypothetical protein H0U44_12225 [Flavisolibacter sp.]|jgi:hypothetical protein|nr:hypothetical protein [Flavisolibacter sp.]